MTGGSPAPCQRLHQCHSTDTTENYRCSAQSNDGADHSRRRNNPYRPKRKPVTGSHIKHHPSPVFSKCRQILFDRWEIQVYHVTLSMNYIRGFDENYKASYAVRNDNCCCWYDDCLWHGCRKQFFHKSDTGEHLGYSGVSGGR